MTPSRETMTPERQREIEKRQAIDRLSRELINTKRWKILPRSFEIDFIEVDGQKIDLPFSNMAGMLVVLERGDDKWIFRGQAMEASDDLRTLLEVYCENEREQRATSRA